MRLDAFSDDDKDECYVSAPPSENIWNKFELDSTVTPPRSPDLVVAHNVDDCDFGLDNFLSNLTRRTLDADCYCDTGPRSTVIHDCMWSAYSGDGARPSLTVTAPGNGAGDRQRNESFDLPSASLAAVIGVSRITAISSVTAAATPDCVDPMAVLPYPLNREHSYSMMTPAPSDSEGEIDVGTETHPIVDSQQRVRTAVSASSRPTAGATSCAAAVSTRYQQQPVRHLSQQQPQKVAAATVKAECGAVVVDMNHNRLSAAASERLLTSSVSQKRTPLRSSYVAGLQQQRLHEHQPYHVGGKRTRRQQSSALPTALLLQQHSPPSSGCSRSSSDSEDYDGKRSMHNVLERKRRNDLKSSFFLLRDHVPELRQQERAAKVVILAKATEYTKRLRQEEACLLAELSAERQKQARLLDQLERLRTSCSGSYYYV